MICRARMNNQVGQAKRMRGMQGEVSGFTLLEMVFVLGMIGILVAWVTVSVASVNKEKKLLKAMDGIESLIRRGRSVAVLQQRPYMVTISSSGISLAPQYVGSEQELYDDDGAELNEREVFKSVTATESIDPEVKYEIRRWRSDVWEEIEGDKKVELILAPEGLVEPISIRCSMDKSWILHTLSPLTGAVRDEEMSVQDD